MSYGFGINCFHLDDSVSGFHVSSFNRYCYESITISLDTQKIPGDDLDPKGSLNEIYAILPMMVISITDNSHAVCSLMYA